MRSSLEAVAIATEDRRICGPGQDLRCHLRRHPAYKIGNVPRTGNEPRKGRTMDHAITMKDKIEALVAGAILVIGLPALMFAVQ